VILHAAAHKHVPLIETNELESLRNNVLGTRVLAEIAMAKSIGQPKPDTAKQRAAVQALSRKQLIGFGRDPLILVDIQSSQQYATLNQISQTGD